MAEKTANAQVKDAVGLGIEQLTVYAFSTENWARPRDEVAGLMEMFGKLIAASLTLTLFIYIFVNMGMVTGQLPVVGVPLPMVSYGGTSLVTILIGFGILMSVQTHRKFIADT